MKSLMNKKNWLSFLGLAFFTLIETGHAESKGVFHPKTFTLANGLQVVLIENHLAPMISMSLVYKVGCADDPYEVYGISHFLEHLLFKGTHKNPSGTFDHQITSRGGFTNAYTTYDQTGCITTIGVEHLPLVLDLEADRMRNLNLSEESVKEERDVVLEEQRMRVENSPVEKEITQAQRITFLINPMGIPVIGYPFQIRNYTAEAAKKHYDTWYHPNNAILIVCGDISEDALRAQVQKAFSNIPRKEVPVRNRPQEGDRTNATTYYVSENKLIKSASFTFTYQVPHFKSEESDMCFPISVLAYIISGNATSRLDRLLVEEKKLASSVTIHYDSVSIDPHPLSISATVAEGIKPETLIKALKEMIQEVIEKGVSDEEVRRAKRDMLAGIAFAKDGLATSVKAFEDLASGVTIDYIETIPDKIQAVTKEQVDQAAKKYLKQPYFISFLYPQGYKEKIQMLP